MSNRHHTTDCKHRRDQALAQQQARYPALIRRIQRAYLRLLLDCGPSTIDPVRAVVPIPSSADPRLVGSAIRALAKAWLIHRAGQSRSVRPEAHSRDLPLWTVSDRAAVHDWLTRNPDLPDNDRPQQRGLFDMID